MNRLSFIKSLIAIPAIPLLGFQSLEGQNGTLRKLYSIYDKVILKFDFLNNKAFISFLQNEKNINFLYIAPKKNGFFYNHQYRTLDSISEQFSYTRDLNILSNLLKKASGKTVVICDSSIGGQEHLNYFFKDLFKHKGFSLHTVS